MVEEVKDSQDYPAEEVSTSQHCPVDEGSESNVHLIEELSNSQDHHHPCTITLEWRRTRCYMNQVNMPESDNFVTYFEWAKPFTSSNWIICFLQSFIQHSMLCRNLWLSFPEYKKSHSHTFIRYGIIFTWISPTKKECWNG